MVRGGGTRTKERVMVNRIVVLCAIFVCLWATSATAQVVVFQNGPVYPMPFFTPSTLCCPMPVYTPPPVYCPPPVYYAPPVYCPPPAYYTPPAYYQPPVYAPSVYYRAPEVWVHPKYYVEGQPVRNFLRAITP